MISLHHAVEFTEVKSSHGVRLVDLDADTVMALKAHRKQEARERLVAGPVWQETGLVFTQADGSLVHPDWFSKMFRGRVKAAGLPLIRLHDLRHGWATIAGKHGVPLRVIQERLGHHDPAFTARQYQHILPGMQRAGAEVFAGAIRSARAGSVAES
jgi:integrase